jgi:hypothetical protein
MYKCPKYSLSCLQSSREFVCGVMDVVCCQPTVYLKPCFIMLSLPRLWTLSAVSYFQQNITFRKSNLFAFSREKAGTSIQFGILDYLITDKNETAFFNTRIWVPVLWTVHWRKGSEPFFLKRCVVFGVTLLDPQTDPVISRVVTVGSALIFNEWRKSKFRSLSLFLF